MRENQEYSPKLHVGFNTISAASTRPEHVLFASIGTTESGKRIVALAKELAKTFDETSVSIIPARNIDLHGLATQLAGQDVKVSSIDVPDVKSLPTGLRDGIKSLAKGNIPEVKSHIGWTLSNVGSETQQLRKTEEGLKQFGNTDEIQIVKANTSFWLHNPRQGAELDTLLQKYQRDTGKKIGLAIEISAEHQTPAEYEAFLAKKRAELENKLLVYADLDLGHIERSRFYHPDSVIDHSVKILEDILEDPARAKSVKIISLNQYMHGDAQAHAQLDKGEVDLAQAVGLMGKSMKAGKLAKDTTALLETHPSDYQWFFDAEGLVFCRKLQDSFNQGAGR